MIELARRLAVQELVAAYGGALDREDYQGWLDLFGVDASYRIAPRENVEQNLPASLMLCETKKAISDRIVALLKANAFRPFHSRHVIGAPEILSAQDGAVQAQASYALYQTDADGRADLFSVGRYDFDLGFTGDRAFIRNAVVVVDSFLIPTLLVKPI